MSKADEARALYQAHPEWTGGQIAKVLGCSRQNVSMALAFIGQSTKRPPRPSRRCAQCPQRISRYRTTGLCADCRRAIIYQTRPCNECGAPITRRRSAWKRTDGLYKTVIPYKGLAFCNRSCFGHWTGKHAGWGQTRLPETPLLQALGLGQTLRVKCRWKHHYSRGCDGRTWARNTIQGQAARISLHCAGGWCYVTKLPLDKARQPVLESALAELCPPEEKEPQA